MKTKLFSAFLFLVLVPGLALADRPDVTGLKQQMIQLIKEVRNMRSELADTHAELTATRAELAVLKNNTVLGLDGLVTLIRDANGFETVRFSGVNLQVVNGEGVTDSLNGLGNVVIGYNNHDDIFSDRLGSHNIILGDNQGYPDTSELVTHKILSNQDLAVIVAGSMETLVGSNRTITVGGARSEDIGGNASVSVGASNTITVGLNKTENIGGSEAITVGANRIVAVGSNKTESIGGSTTMNFGNDVNMSVASNMSMIIGKELAVDAGDEIILNTGSASALFKKDGTIAIEGKDISIQGSGDISLKAAKDVIIKGSRILQN
jgi:hypothetical protein